LISAPHDTGAGVYVQATAIQIIDADIAGPLILVMFDFFAVFTHVMTQRERNAYKC